LIFQTEHGAYEIDQEGKCIRGLVRGLVGVTSPPPWAPYLSVQIIKNSLVVEWAPGHCTVLPPFHGLVPVLS
jgi:hypothetical protein